MPAGLDLSVDRASDVPVGTQLAWKLRTLVATGALSPGAKLPGIREVAQSASVNVNTVRSVFARLEEQGLLVSEQGRGTFVAATARLDETLTDAAKATIAKALAAGVDPRELAAALYVSTAMSPPAATPGDRYEGGENAAAVSTAEARDERRSLYREIEQMEREIGRLDPLSTIESRPHAGAEPRVLGAAELRRVRDNLAARVDQLIRERQEWRAETEQHLAAERARADRASTRPWRAGIWTSRPGAKVSWRTT